MSKDKTIHVLQIITSMSIGGAEKVLLDIISNESNRINSHLFVLTSKKEMLAKQNITIPITFFNIKKNPFSIFSFVVNGAKYIKRNRIEIIHAHMYHSAVLACIIKLINFNTKVVFTHHNVNHESKLREIILYLFRLFRTVDIKVGEQEDKYYYKSRSEIIPNTVLIKNSIDYKVKNVTESFNFTCIGRLHEQKGYEDLIKKVVTKIPNNYKFKIRIAGSGILKGHLQRLITENNLQDRVVLLGRIDHVNELLCDSDLLLMPSKYEGLPLALLEAGVLSLPVLCTPVGNITTLITNKNGYISSIESFADSMIHIMNNHDEAIEKGKLLRKLIVRDFNIPKSVRMHSELYSSILT